VSRIDPLPPKQWPEEMREALAGLRPANARLPLPRREGRAKGLNVLGTMARHPELARAFFGFNGHVLYATTLSERQRELVVLRVAALRDSEYEWAQHAALAHDAGIDAGEVARVSEGPDAPGWAPLEQAMLRAVDELVLEGTVTDDTWKALGAELSTEQLMDLVFTVGTYVLLAMAFNAFGLELDE